MSNISSSNLTTLYSGSNAPVANGNVVIPGTLTVNGCAILTNCSAFSLLPTNATSILFGNAATSMSIGSGSGATTINNQLATANYDFPVSDGTANQVLTTDGAGNLSFASISSLGVLSITGTANQVIVSSPTGAVTLSLPQDIATTSNVTFGDVAVNGGDITTTALTANIFTTTATQINIGTAGNGTQANGGVIDLGISGQTWNVDVNAVVLTQNGTTSQVTGKNLNTTQTTPLEIMSTQRKAMKGFVTVTDDVTGAIHSIAFLAIRKTSTADAYITIYAEIFSDAPLATFTVTDSTGNLRLFATPLSLNSTDITIMRHSLGD